jgi:uncharacterized membrane protein YdbT with pleckstrin-like domain
LTPARISDKVSAAGGAGMNDQHPDPTASATPDHGATLHWVVFGRALFAVAVAAAFLATRHHLLGLLFLLAGVGFAADATRRVRSFELRLSVDGIVAAWGLVHRETVDLPLARLRSIAVRQGPLGRLLGYGTVVLSSSTGSEVTLHNVAAPFAFRIAALRRVDDLQSRTTEVVARPG